MQTIHVLWLKPEDYPRFRAIFADVDDTYEAWRERMDRRIAQLIAQGIYAERILIDPDELVQWCRDNGRQIDANARAAYPAVRAMLNDERSD